MKSSELNAFLLATSTGKDLKAITENEVSSYARLMEKRGSRIPLIFDENEELFLNEAAIKNSSSRNFVRKLK